MNLTTISIAQFKAKFYRDFTYTNISDSPPMIPPGNDVVQDMDIQNAFNDAQASINQGNFPNDAAITSGYLLLSAHYLALALKGADGGINGTGNFPVSSRSVGSVSETYQIPDAYKNRAILAPYTTTSYGMRYLTMVLPYLQGNVVTAQGGVAPQSDANPNYPNYGFVNIVN